MRECCKLKEAAPDRTVRRTGFGRGCGLVVRQTGRCAITWELHCAFQSYTVHLRVTLCIWELHCAFESYTVHFFFLTIKPTRCTNFSNLFLELNSTCFGQFLCPSSGVYHCTHSNGICHTGLLTACEKDQDGISVPYWSCSYRFADSLRAGSGWNFSYILILLIQVCWQLASRIKMEFQFHTDPAHTGLLTACEKDQDGISVPYWSCSYGFADSLREGSGWNFSSILILLIQVCWQLARRIRMEFQSHPDPAHTGLLTACEKDQDGTSVPSWSCSQTVSKPVWHIPLLRVQ